ncbi:MAG: hypothetical protein IKF14_07385 [Atopobiaceae bacterium]|nr:hypothetical protein [Atopobiaceae bacterium]
MSKPQRVIGALRCRVLCDRGETMAETLVSILISALALLLLATAIGTSVRVVMRGREHAASLFAVENNLVENAVDSSSPLPAAETVECSVPLSLEEVSDMPNETESVNVYSGTNEDGGDAIYLYMRNEG